MSKNSLILVLQNKQENPTIDMAKIQIKSEKLTPFGGIFSIMEQFDSTLSCSLMSIYFCGGSCTPGCHYSFVRSIMTSLLL